MRPILTHQKDLRPYFFRLFYLFLFISFTTHNYLNIYFRELGFTGVQFGMIKSLSSLVMLLSQPFWGFICDLTGRRGPVLSILLFFSGLSFLLVLLTENYYMILLIIFIYAFFKSPIVPVADSMVLQYLKGDGSKYSAIRLYGALGLTFSVVGIGYYLERSSISHLFFIYTFFTGLVLILNWSIPGEERSARQGINLSQWLFFLKRPLFFLFLVGVFFLQTAAFIFDGFFGLFMKDTFGSEFLLGVSLTIGGISEILVYHFLGKRRINISPSLLLVICAFFSTARWLLYPFAEAILTVFIIQVLHGFTFGIFYIAGVIYTCQLLPEELVTTGQTFFWAMAFGLCCVSGSLLGGFLYDYKGYGMMFRAASLLALFSGGIFLLLQQKESHCL